MSKDALHLRERAEECRCISHSYRSIQIRAIWLRLAWAYETQAAAIEYQENELTKVRGEKEMVDSIQMSNVLGSSNIKAVGYDEEKQELRIEFNNGGLYAYDSVPPEIHQRLMADKSKGKFVHTNVKGKFNTRKLK